MHYALFDGRLSNYLRTNRFAVINRDYSHSLINCECSLQHDCNRDGRNWP
jgi:hypothetical protein